MKLEITDDQSIEEVQELFHHCFPFLRVDFFERGTTGLTRNKVNKPILNKKRLLGEFRLDKTGNGLTPINNDIKVSEFEQYIDLMYSLQAQVFRRSGNVWLETTVTNHWTLGEQNRQGEIITAQMEGVKI